MNIPFRCEAFPSVATQSSASYVTVHEKEDEHEGFFFFLEPTQSTSFDIIQRVYIQNYGSYFITIYGYTKNQELDQLLPYFENSRSLVPADDQKETKKEMSLSIFGSTLCKQSKSISFGHHIRKRWTVVVPETQLLSMTHYEKKDSVMWQKQRVFTISPRIIDAQQTEPFLGLYVECRPMYDYHGSAIVGLGGIDLVTKR